MVVLSQQQIFDAEQGFEAERWVLLRPILAMSQVILARGLIALFDSGMGRHFPPNVLRIHFRIKVRRCFAPFISAVLVNRAMRQANGIDETLKTMLS